MPANLALSEVFTPPSDANATLWRYMDFAKYVAMLDRRALFFARADLLGDPFEGSVTELDVKVRSERAKARLESLLAFNVDLPDAALMNSQFNRSVREWTYINCWHRNAGESAAMWKLYAQSNQAVAITTTYNKLVEVLPQQAYVGAVRYVDYKSTTVDTLNVLGLFMHKRLSFEHEQEIRAVMPIWTSGCAVNLFTPNPHQGISVPVDLGGLIEKIYAAPEAPEWFRDLVSQVSVKYGLARAVVTSSLDDRPLY